MSKENQASMEVGRQPLARLPSLYRRLEENVRLAMENMQATERWGYFSALQRCQVQPGQQQMGVAGRGVKFNFLDVSESIKQGIPLSVPVSGGVTWDRQMSDDVCCKAGCASHGCC